MRGIAQQDNRDRDVIPVSSTEWTRNTEQHRHLFSLGSSKCIAHEMSRQVTVFKRKHLTFTSLRFLSRRVRVRRLVGGCT